MLYFASAVLSVLSIGTLTGLSRNIAKAKIAPTRRFLLLAVVVSCSSDEIESRFHLC